MAGEVAAAAAPGVSNAKAAAYKTGDYEAGKVATELRDAINAFTAATGELSSAYVTPKSAKKLEVLAKFQKSAEELTQRAAGLKALAPKLKKKLSGEDHKELLAQAALYELLAKAHTAFAKSGGSKSVDAVLSSHGKQIVTKILELYKNSDPTTKQTTAGLIEALKAIGSGSINKTLGDKHADLLKIDEFLRDNDVQAITPALKGGPGQSPAEMANRARYQPQPGEEAIAA